jgi:flagellar hook-associated protein 2
MSPEDSWKREENGTFQGTLNIFRRLWQGRKAFKFAGASSDLHREKRHGLFPQWKDRDMGLSTNLISGLSSGFDWRSMIDQLMSIEHRPVDLMENTKTEYQSKLSEWQSFNSKLLSLKSAAEALKDADDFQAFTSRLSTDSATYKGSDLLSVSTSSSAAQGSYSVKIQSLATAQKLSSASFDSASEALGTSYAGDILINGKAILIDETDTLTSLRDRINNANAGSTPTGVTASIVNYGPNDYRIILTSDKTGAEGISLQNGSGSSLVERFGWKDKDVSLKHAITGGAQSDAFSSSTQDIKTLLGLSTTQSGDIVIDGQSISLDLAEDSLEDIKNKINAAGISGVTASITESKNGASTSYRLQIEGTQNVSDSQNILESLGILQKGVSDINGTTSTNTMTEDGSKINASTLLTDIDGYFSYTGGDHITISGLDHAGNSVNVNFDIDPASTVQDLLDAIENAFGAQGSEVSAHVTSDGKIQAEDLETGSSQLSVSLTSEVGNGALTWGDFSALDVVRKRELIQGQDASLLIDGVNVTSADNTITDVLPGVTLNLLAAASDTTITLTIDRDIDAIINKVNTFVSAYNAVASYISDQQAYDQEKEKTGGILFGDGTLSSVKADLTTTLIQSVWGVASEYTILGMVGVNLDKEGQLSLDSDTLRRHLQTNFNDVRDLFAATGTTSKGSLEYVSHERVTKAGDYTVNITQAADRSTTTSGAAVSSTLGFDEVLTIASEGKTASIELSSTMTLPDILHAINTELDKVYTQTLAGSEQLYADAGRTQMITSATTLDSIFDASGASAGLQDNDVISFTGTSRAGAEITGSYIISDISTDTVQGILSAIESAFGNGVTAAVDSSGHISVTDKKAGDSQLALSFDLSQAHDLDFGTVSISQQGRYAMDITATSNVEDHLVLTHDFYGNARSFTVSESTDTGLWTNSQSSPTVVDNGQDVAGTINGEAATGAGQILTGNSGEANVDGLVVKYTGTSIGEIGNVKLTLGTGELFSRVLFAITDPYEGYASFKQDSLKNSINQFETRIQETEDRLDRKMEMMVNRFVAMEKALSMFQSQSQWLSGQINALYAA